MGPHFVVGDTFTYEDTGVPVKEQVTGFAGPRATWQNDRGVTWVQAPDVISPPISWSGDPRLGQGNQQIFGEPGKLFPLESGKTVKFQVAGVAEKVPDGWQAENSCTAVTKEAVKVKAGEFQTWRIACQRGEVLETIYYVPEIMTYALRTRERGKELPYERKELVAFDLAQSPDRPLPAMAAAAMKTAITGSPAGWMMSSMSRDTGWVPPKSRARWWATTMSPKPRWWAIPTISRARASMPMSR